jgi:hypothetical protein
MMFRILRRGITRFLRATEVSTRFFGGMPWKTKKFNRLIEPEIAAAAKTIATAEVIVGIPFYLESENIGRLTRTICRDLEACGERAAVVIVSEHRTKHLLCQARLAPSTPLVTVLTLVKPFGFAQKPGLGRRSWSHWAILRLADRLSTDVVFIDADVRNPEGWVGEYLDAIRRRGATIAVANYVRDFSSDDALVHVWDRLIFGALFKTWIAFRHGGDYAISRTLISELLRNPSIMRERAYTMDSAVMRLAARKGARIEAVWLGEKIHAPITSQDLFNRLPVLVESVFDDVADHLSVLLKLHGHSFAPRAPRVSKMSRPMHELIGDDFRLALSTDQALRFREVQSHIRRLFGTIAFKRLAAASSSPAESAELLPADWATLTIGLLEQYLMTRDQARKSALIKAYVPILQLGALAFLNRTYSMRYNEAARLLGEQYLPVFEQAWGILARRISSPPHSLLRKWPLRLRRVIGVGGWFLQP